MKRRLVLDCAIYYIHYCQIFIIFLYGTSRFLEDNQMDYNVITPLFVHWIV